MVKPLSVDEYQIVLIVTTKSISPDLRADIQGWTYESGKEAAKAICQSGDSQIMAGMIGGYHGPSYPTVLHALGDGFRLLAPPVKDHTMQYDNQKRTADASRGIFQAILLLCDVGKIETYWEWWLVKEVPLGS
jgi:hypothetical protein